MDETPLRGYPFPECDPPYVQDTADLPLDLYNMLTAMDTDVTALQAAATDALVGASAILGNTAPPAVALTSGSTVRFNTIQTTSAGVTPDTTLGRFVLNVAGVWVFTGGYTATASVAANQFQLAVLQNGVAIETHTWNQAGIAGINGVIETVFVGNVGDAITLQTNFASGTVTMTAAQMGIARMVKL